MVRLKSNQNFEKYEEAFSSFITLSIHRLKRQPYILFPALGAYLRGLYYKIKFKIFLKRVNIGRHFRVYGRLVISGPGRVTFGDNCFIMSHAIKTVRIRTLLPSSRINLGNHVGLNGTSIVSTKKIDIGDYANIADAYIADSSAHPLSIDRRLFSPPDIPAESVIIGKNVWINVSVVILKGVHIGENTVIGACSLVRESLPPNVLAAGIPAVVIRQLPEKYTLHQK